MSLIKPNPVFYPLKGELFALHLYVQVMVLYSNTNMSLIKPNPVFYPSQESCSLFICLYKSWCHDPVSTVALCFLSQNYEHACNLLTMLYPLPARILLLHSVGVPGRGSCPLERISPQYPLLGAKGDKKGERNEKLHLETLWKNLLRAARR